MNKSPELNIKKAGNSLLGAVMMGATALHGISNPIPKVENNNPAVTAEAPQTAVQPFDKLVAKIEAEPLTWKNGQFGVTAKLRFKDGHLGEVSLSEFPKSPTSTGKKGLPKPDSVQQISVFVYPKGTNENKLYAVPQFTFRITKSVDTFNNKQKDALDSYMWVSGTNTPEYSVDPHSNKSFILDVDGKNQINYQLGDSNNKTVINEALATKLHVLVQDRTLSTVDSGARNLNLPPQPRPAV